MFNDLVPVRGVIPFNSGNTDCFVHFLQEHAARPMVGGVAGGRRVERGKARGKEERIIKY